MKRYLSLFVVLILLGAGCTADGPGSAGNPIGEYGWDGEWRLVSELLETPDGEIVSPLTGKLLIIDGDQMLEDYSALEGLGEDCSTEGEIASVLEIHENVATASGANVLVEPNITCGAAGNAGTNAVPRTLSEMGWVIENWEDQIIATAVYNDVIVEHVYER